MCDDDYGNNNKNNNKVYLKLEVSFGRGEIERREIRFLVFEKVEEEKIKSDIFPKQYHFYKKMIRTNTFLSNINQFKYIK